MPMTGVISGIVTPKYKTRSNSLARQKVEILSKSVVSFQYFPMSLRGGSFTPKLLRAHQPWTLVGSVVLRKLFYMLKSIGFGDLFRLFSSSREADTVYLG